MVEEQLATLENVEPKKIGWWWRKFYATPEVLRKNGNLRTLTRVKLTNPEKVGDVRRFHNHPVCLITGDGSTMPNEVRLFESWNIPHDLYCVNRSLLFFERQVDHWAAIDIEESIWFAENITEKVEPDHRVIRHTIGDCALAYDVCWLMDFEETNTYQKRVLVGNTGYFAILTALEMGYEKIVLAGMPLDMNPCWYEHEDTDGPNWMGWMYVQWMDFKMKTPERANQVRSLGGYSSFILGQATKEWLNAS